MTRQLYIDELCMAWLRKRLTQQMALVFHSDGPRQATRHSEYASQAFRKALKGYGMVQSMNGTGNCFDSAPMESFWYSLKVQEVNGRGWLCNSRKGEACHRRLYRSFL